jgi:hypothetical protein
MLRQVLKELRELKVRKGHKVLRDPKARQGVLVILVLKVLKVLKD